MASPLLSLVLLLLLSAAVPAVHGQPVQGFVQRSGGRLLLNGQVGAIAIWEEATEGKCEG